MIPIENKLQKLIGNRKCKRFKKGKIIELTFL